MKQIILLFCLLATTSCCFAQLGIGFAFTSEEDNRLLKEEGDSVKYYVASGDTADVVYFNEESSVYRLYNKHEKLIAEGKFSIVSDNYLQQGNWTEYYDDGKIKMAGYYHDGKPMGVMQEFYNNGKLKVFCNYAIIKEAGYTYSCLSGSYSEYGESGKIKTRGFYASNMEESCNDTIYVIDPVSRQKVMKIAHSHCPKAEKAGTWEYFSENGDLDKKEDF